MNRTAALVALASLVLHAPASQATPPGVTLPEGRMRQLRPMLRRILGLERQGVLKGYVSLFQADPQVFRVQRKGAELAPPSWSTSRSQGGTYEGAAVVATVEYGPDGQGMRAWYDAIGKDSIGFATRSFPGKKGSVPGTLIRIGKDIFFYKAVRGDVEDVDGQTIAYGPQDVLERSKPFTEATFLASEKEMKAVKAFILARHLKLFKHYEGKNRGQPILPVWQHDGAPGNFAKESCAQACTSFIDGKWLEAYRHLFPELKRDARFAELIGPNDTFEEMQRVLVRFAGRTGLQRFTGFKEPIRRQFHTAQAITVFNTGTADPRNDLSWTQGGWLGLTPPVVPLDLQPGKKSNELRSTRVSLGEFAGSL